MSNMSTLGQLTNHTLLRGLQLDSFTRDRYQIKLSSTLFRFASLGQIENISIISRGDK